MAVIGWITVVVIAVVVLIAAAVLLRSIPDIRRYSRIRKM